MRNAECGLTASNTERRAVNAKGFTLIEIIITIVIVSILAGIAGMIIIQGVKSYSDEEIRSDVHYQAKLGVERAAREARMVRSCGDIVGPANPAATLSFTDITGNLVTFAVAGNTLQRNGVLLANNVTSAQPFRFLDSSGNPTTSCAAPNDIWFVEIALSVQQGAESLDMRTRVHPRNF